MSDTDVIDAVVARLPPQNDHAPFLVAVDGVDGSGKTTFADRLGARLSEAGRPTVRIMLDDFLNPAEVRYRLGRHSPDGFFRDTYDYGGFTAFLDDLTTAPGSVIIVDGMFLHRDELVGRWDFSIFLDVPFAETARRMALRDGTHPDPEHPSMHRYVAGQRIYLGACRPAERADLVIDNADVRDPRIIDDQRA